MKTPFPLLSLCVFALGAHAQSTDTTLLTRARGNLIFNRQAVVFRAATGEERYPLFTVRTGLDTRAPGMTVIPGLIMQKFEERRDRTGHDVSQLTLAGANDTLIELVVGKLIAVVRTDTESADHRHETHWRLDGPVP